jgi:hypothetical protein
MNNHIVVIHENAIYDIEKEQFETDENTYKRAWFMIKNQNVFTTLSELISRSFIYLNEKKNNMKYDVEMV